VPRFRTRPLPTMLVWALALLVAGACACSNFLMPHDTGLSGRTMDLGSIFGLDWEFRTFPLGSATRSSRALPNGVTRFGFVGVIPIELKLPVASLVTAGLNEAGLSCDMQTLISTEYPPPSNTAADLDALYFCEWALGAFADTDSARAALLDPTAVHFTGPEALSGSLGQHYVLRDRLGRSLVVEFVGGQQQVYQDLDDGGTTGFGLMTNEPEYPWMVRMVQHFTWKQSLARSSTSLPGGFYPDERLLRLHLVKQGLPAPQSYREAVQQAAHMLDVVTVPPGAQMGTDSGAGEGEGDHTMWAVLYDHRNSSIYFRTSSNHNFGRVALDSLRLTAGSSVASLPLSSAEVPWVVDATAAFSSSRRAPLLPV